jgi:hypothetical protein
VSQKHHCATNSDYDSIDLSDYGEVITIKKYLRLPTHTKEGWLVFLAGFILVGSINVLFGISLGIIQVLFLVAFIIEVVAKVLGKNKPLKA